MHGYNIYLNKHILQYHISNCCLKCHVAFLHKEVTETKNGTLGQYVTL